MGNLYLVTVSGKWQKRIVQTLHEAQCPLKIRQLRIRCGMLYDTYGTCMRTSLARLAEKGIIEQVGYGTYRLVKGQQEEA